jgi:signal-transduction protein with cAMP-binding, CBS, and nucleotidyltransferase domain
LAQLSDQERNDLIDQLIARDVRRGEYIVRAGNRPNGLHLIELGQCAIARDGQVMGHSRRR